MPPFFDDYTPYCEQIRNGQFSRAVDDGLSLLKHIKQFEPKKYLTEPKGTPFYWLGIAAFASHDYQTATFFFDAAVSEDLIHHRGDKNQPALLFMRLDENLAEQAALPIVHKIVARLEDAIDDYKARLDSDALTMGDVREYFLNHLNHPTRPNLRSLTTTFVSFVAEWDYRESMIDLSQEGSKEPFFTHLFRGCLLFESLLKENPAEVVSKTATLKKLLSDDRLKQRLGIANEIETYCPDFEPLLQSLQPNEPLQAAIQCTAKTRNALAHSLAWTVQSLKHENYGLLANNISAACLHAISRLYR